MIVLICGLHRPSTASENRRYHPFWLGKSDK
jgi:hypothetical protein